jgi:serine phosphatase RsbU (regulator of sigma subunit)/anti-sigma regulatory factor (Ser/Thr protein kinase)
MKLFEAQIEATLGGVRLLRQRLQRRLKNVQIADAVADDFCLAVNEAATNAVVHARPAPSTLILRVDLSGMDLKFKLMDDGAPYQGFDARLQDIAPDEPLHARDGGLGLPLLRATLNEISYQPGQPNVLSGRRRLYDAWPMVLLLEDDELMLELYALYLGERFRVTPVQTIAAAKAAIVHTVPDVIVSDFHIGTDNAIDLLSMLDESPLSRPIPIVMITADRNRETRQAVLLTGVEQFLTKPVSAEQLNQAVEVALSSYQKRLSHFFSYFGRNTQTLLNTKLPERIGDYLCKTLHAEALWGGGDFKLHLPTSSCERLILGDAMGHGLTAKATAMTYLASLHTIDALSTTTAAGLLQQVSAVIAHPNFPEGVLATLLIADLFRDGQVEIANAGHPPPALLTRTHCTPGMAGGPLPGLDAQAVYETQAYHLQPGDRLILTTDGLDPTGTADGSFPGALREQLALMRNAPLDELCRGLSAWTVQALGAAPRDDWTLIIIERAT